MKKMSMGAVVLLASLASGAALAASTELELAKTYDALLGGTSAAAKQKLGCTGAWLQSNGTSVTGKQKYLVFRCEATEGQIYEADGKVFAVGLRLHQGLNSQKASALHKEAKAGLTTAGCKVTDRGQAAVARCASGKAMALLENWDSKTDTHTISMLYGVAEVMLPVMGMPVN